MKQLHKFLEDKLNQSSITRLSGFISVIVLLTIALIGCGWLLVAKEYTFVIDIQWILTTLILGLFTNKTVKDIKETRKNNHEK